MHMHQLVTEPTHIHGNTLDLICASKPDNLEYRVLFPGLSDHAIVTVNMHLAHAVKDAITYRSLKQINKADIEQFQDVLEGIGQDLSNMDDVNDMWTPFSRNLQQAVSDHVPVVNCRIKQYLNEPIWFNKECHKVAQKQRKLYNRYLHSKDSFDKNAAASHKRLAKKTYCETKRSYMVKQVCQPLKEGNNKPFYRHLKGLTQYQNQITLVAPEGKHVTDPKICANLLNNYFHQQFSCDIQLTAKSSQSFPRGPSHHPCGRFEPHKNAPNLVKLPVLMESAEHI